VSEASAVILAALIASAAALWIGSLQVARIREQNRIAMFEKRLACFRKAQEALSLVMRDGKASGEACAIMVEALQASWFIFPRDLSDRLKKVYRRMLDINLHQARRENPSPGKSRNDHITEEFSALNEVVSELESLRDIFEPHMHVNEPRNPIAWVDDLLDWIEGKTPPKAP
jgi:hypothetical protein